MKNFFFLILLIIIFIFSCKTKTDVVINDPVITDPTKFVIDETKLDENDLKRHIEALFALIESMIAKGEYKGWYNSISSSYKHYLSDAANLQKISNESDVLYNRKVVLKGPKDYFEYVVMPSREGKKLKFNGYKYIDKYHIKVFCLFDNKDKFDYNFTFEDGSWKIDR